MIDKVPQMNAFRCARALVMVCVISFAHSDSYAETKPAPRIFSNVEYIEEAGDLVGYELEFPKNSPRTTGVLRIYEGGCGERVPLSGMDTAGKLYLHGESQVYGKVEIRGKVGSKLLKITLRMEKAVKPETLVLKPIPKPHC